jgi:hypothetical protein
MSTVAALLGTSPWSDEAPRTLVVAVQAPAGQLAARIEMRGARGAVTGVRELSSTRPDCKELAEAMALAIAIAIDPLSAARLGTGAPPPASLPAREGQARDREFVPNLGRAPPVSGPSEQPPPPRVRFVEAGVGGHVAVGAAPEVAGGLAVHAGLRWPRLSAHLEGRFDFPREHEVLGGVIGSSLILASATGCGHYSWLYGCGIVAAGAIRTSGGAEKKEAKITLPYAAVGIRAGVELPLLPVLSLRAQADLLAPMTHITLRETDTDEELWTSPPVSGAFGLSLVGHFF